MLIEDLVKEYKELSAQITALEEKRKAIGKKILPLMPAKKYQVDQWVVRIQSRLSIKTTIEEAKQLGLSKLEEVVDKDKIKELVALGHAIPNVSMFEYVTVSSSASSSAYGGELRSPSSHERPPLDAAWEAPF
jgi:hypothetical protein